MKNFRILSAVALAAALFFSQGVTRVLAAGLALKASCRETDIGELRRKGLDVVLVIDGTSSMSLVDDVKAKMGQLVHSMHLLVPIARIGIVVSGRNGETVRFQPLTLSSQKLIDFLNVTRPTGGGDGEESIDSAYRQAIEKMDWKPYARKVVVLISNSPPPEDFAPLLAMIRRFKDDHGSFDIVHVAGEERGETQAAYRVLAKAGGGSMKSLTKGAKIDEEVLRILALCAQKQWQVVAAGGGGSQQVCAAERSSSVMRDSTP